MPRVKPVRDAEQAFGWSISKLQIEARVSMGTARRYWYGTQDGTPGGPPMTLVDLNTATRVATALGVDWRDLVEDWQSLQPASA
jgi:hypothetical protein